MKQAVLHSNDIECDGCANTIKQVLSSVTGVSTVSVDVANKNVNVEFSNDTEVSAIEKAMENAGFEVSR